MKNNVPFLSYKIVYNGNGYIVYKNSHAHGWVKRKNLKLELVQEGIKND